MNGLIINGASVWPEIQMLKTFWRIFTILLNFFFKSLGLYVLVSCRLDLTQKYVSSCIHGFTWSSSNSPLECPTNFGYQPLHIAHVEKHTGNKQVGNQIDISFLTINFKNWLTKKVAFCTNLVIKLKKKITLRILNMKTPSSIKNP